MWVIGTAAGCWGGAVTGAGGCVYCGCTAKDCESTGCTTGCEVPGKGLRTPTAGTVDAELDIECLEDGPAALTCASAGCLCVLVCTPVAPALAAAPACLLLYLAATCISSLADFPAPFLRLAAPAAGCLRAGLTPAPLADCCCCCCCRLLGDPQLELCLRWALMGNLSL
jgi:hypothetical protein